MARRKAEWLTERGESPAPPRAAGWYRDPPGIYGYGYWDGSAWRRDVSAATNLMRANSFTKFFMRRGALARIGEFVPPDETVEFIAAGFHENTWGRPSVVVVLTDRRLLLLSGSRRLAGLREYPRESISSAKSGWSGFTVTANGKKLQFGHMNVHDADDMVHAIQDRTSGGRRRVRYDLGKIKRWRVTEE